MDTVLGHLLTGALFVAFAAKWTLCGLRKHLEVVQSCPGQSSRPPCRSESVVKLLAAVTGVLSVVVRSHTHPDEEADPEDTYQAQQHVTIFMFFALSALFDLLAPLPGCPDGLHSVMLAMAFGVEAVLLSWHLEHRSGADAELHTFLMYSAALCSLACGAQLVVLPGQPLMTLAKATFTCLQGTWLCQIGLVIRRPDAERPDWHPAWICCLFTWHLFAIILAQTLIAALVANKAKLPATMLYVRLAQDEASAASPVP